MGMVRILFLGFVFLLLGYSYVQSTISYASDDHLRELESMLSWAEEEQLIVQDWQLRIREGQGRVKDQDAFLQHVHNLNKLLVDWNLSNVNVADTEWSMTATRPAPWGEGEEQLHVYAYDQNGSYEIIHTYAWLGSSEDLIEWEKMNDVLNERKTMFSMQQSPVFSQVTAVRTENSEYGKQSLIEEARLMLSDLGATEVESLNEETFVSVSAYNNVWTDAIVTNGQKMNLQLALRQEDTMGSGTTVTIGTPIITTEY
ncbi:YwmB family TATA-box binding protein [Bacillus sp. FJAT-45037]|uniref:YwmB family TATA-box binding protein n=1 Tax=Bacillus sp. FJAT-45037 TaxID=2011007 RepID=UPI0012FE6A81|nr:YwmB family TATA-box binding protein [Bacillus sp. FJAT-45037]